MAVQYIPDDSIDAVVIDNGSGSLHAGIAGEDAPSVVFPSMIGKPRHQSLMKELDNKDTFVGYEAHDRRSLLSLRYPIEKGIITNWDDIETIWNHVYQNELHLNPEDQPVLLSETPFNPMAQKEKMAQIMFEKFNVPGLSIVIQTVLSFYASGRNSGIVCESGAGVTHVLPIYEGYTVSNAIQRIDMGGRDLTNYQSRLMAERGYTFNTTAEREIVREMKEQLCYVAQDFDVELASKSSEEEIFTLPDGQEISLGTERFRCPEALFKPSIMGLYPPETPGIHQSVYNCLMTCEIDTRPNLACNVILSGGNTLFEGIKERMRDELKSLLSPTLRVNVVAYPERNYFVWIGGSILASLTTFRNNSFLGKAEYEERGPWAVHHKQWLV